MTRRSTFLSKDGVSPQRLGQSKAYLYMGLHATSLQDALISIPWLCVSLLLIIAAVKISDHLFGRGDLMKTIQTTVIVAWITILVVGIMLGFVSGISGKSYVVSVGLLAAIIRFVSRYQPSDIGRDDQGIQV